MAVIAQIEIAERKVVRELDFVPDPA